MRVTKAYSFQEEIQALGARLREPTCHGRREIEPPRWYAEVAKNSKTGLLVLLTAAIHWLSLTPLKPKVNALLFGDFSS